jgi:PAT family beta-lactamase induction signal transducer AmpG
MSVFAQLFTRRMLICVFTGFSSGLPLYLLFNLLPAWLRSEHVDLKTIGLFALIQFPYTWKFLWSPLLDRYVLPLLGRRRGWMLITQVGLLLVIASMGAFSPQSDLRTIAYIATLLAFLSATQDIVLDAYRREGVAHVWLVSTAMRSIEVLRRHDLGWLLVATFRDDAVVRAEPFDAVEISLAGLWAS